MFSKLIHKILDSIGVIHCYDRLKNKTVQNTYNTIDAIFRIGLAALFCLVLIWSSILFYVMFYYSYVPTIEHMKPANLQFTACERRHTSSRAICGFPKAHIELTRYNSLLMVGQPYRISIVMELPESDTNKQLGMFMVCGQLVGNNGKLIANSCRSTMLRYRSPLLHFLRLFVLGPLYVLDVMEEKQTLLIELFTNFEDDQNLPVTDMYIELKSDQIEVYSAKVQIDANLSGLRHLMFHWPFLSAFFGSVFNLGAIVFVMLLSWYKLYGPSDISGKEFIIKQLKELAPVQKLAFTSEVEILGEDDTNKNVEEIEGKKCLILKSDDLEEDCVETKRFPLKRKLSSSDA